MSSSRFCCSGDPTSRGLQLYSALDKEADDDRSFASTRAVLLLVSLKSLTVESLLRLLLGDVALPDSPNEATEFDLDLQPGALNSESTDLEVVFSLGTVVEGMPMLSMSEFLAFE